MMEELNKEIKWVKKEDFKPLENEWYWAIIPKKKPSKGYCVPFTVVYEDNKYKTAYAMGDEAHESNTKKISHVAEIVYPI